MTRFVLTFAFLAAVPATAQPSGAPLDEALQTFARQRGVRLVYSGDLVGGLRTRCPVATRSSDGPVLDILACLLGGTGLEARSLPSGTFALYRSVAPALQTPLPRSSPDPIASAPAVTVSGTVVDATTGEPLIGAAVYAPALERGTTTNAYGFYSLPLPPGPIRLVASYVGFLPWDETVDLHVSQRRDVALPPDTSGLGEVVVEAADVPPAAVHASVALTGEDVQSLPALAGEADLMKALQLQPGVGGGAEGTAGLHVRGGTPDQTLLLLDGVPVYNASHLFGFLSVFNADAVKHVELFKGSVPARYGGRLSSVVDVRMREGNEREREGHVRVGLLSGQALVEGQLSDWGTFFVAGRRTYVDALASPFFLSGGDLEGISSPTVYFYDVNAKANARLSDRDRLYVSLYGGRDRFAGASENEQTRDAGALMWGNLTGSVRWTRMFTDRLFAATTLVASDYQFDVGLESERVDDVDRTVRFASRYASGIRDRALRTDLDWTPSAAHSVSLGGAVTRHTYTPGAFTYQTFETATDTTLGADPSGSWEGAVYAEDEVRAGPARVSAGIRATVYTVDGATYGSVEPRLAGRLSIADGLAVRASYGRMTQYLHLLTTIGGIGLPADLWVPATERIGPEHAWQVAAGVGGTVGRTRWTIDGYLKEMDGLVDYLDDALLVRADADWQDEVAIGGGRSRGLEVAVVHTGRRTATQLAYTLSKADRQFDALEGGARFPYRYDRTHDLALTARHRLSSRLDVSAVFVYQTGRTATLPIVTYFGPEPGVDLTNEVFPRVGGVNTEIVGYGERNGFRLPTTHRLDIALDLYFRRGPRPHALSLQVYNVYNRTNPFYVVVSQRSDPETGEATPTLVGRSLFPFLPSVSYEFSL